jgi:hypothetical protein
MSTASFNIRWMLFFKGFHFAKKHSNETHYTLSTPGAVCCCFEKDEDRKLLKEIGKNGEGRAEAVQQLLDEVKSRKCHSISTACALKIGINASTGVK